jgi:predicted ribosome quality control (RQC) complex YloA/Tae2 family protein
MTQEKKTPFDSFVMRCVTWELSREICGGAIQRITQPSDHDMIWEIRHNGKNHRLIFSTDPQNPRFHLTKEKRSNPLAPPQFCMVCRKYLEGGRIHSIIQAEIDRVIRILVHSSMGTFCFMAEMMGNRSNLILLNTEGVLIDAMRHVPQRLNRFRQLLPNMPYSPPPVQTDKKNPFEEFNDDPIIHEPGFFEDQISSGDYLLHNYRGFSPFLAAEIALRIQNGSIHQAWAEVILKARENKWNPQLAKNDNGLLIGAYPIPTTQLPSNSQIAFHSLNEALDAYFSDFLPRMQFEIRAKELTGQIRRAERSLRNRKRELDEAIANASKADWWRECADLLVINRHLIPEGATEARTSDLYHPENEERIIPLDPSLSIQENIETYYRKSRKAIDGMEILRHQAERVKSLLQALQDAMEQMTQLTYVDQLQRLREELISQGVLREDSQEPSIVGKRNAPLDFAGKRIRSLHTSDGWEILYGENSEANDYLTTRIAQPTDIWLHVRSNASAHVVIRTNRHPEKTPMEVIRKAAVIAAKHSAAKHSGMAPVDYTLRKYVRKPRGAAQGMVSYQYEKTLHVETGD